MDACLLLANRIYFTVFIQRGVMFSMGKSPLPKSVTNLLHAIGVASLFLTLSAGQCSGALFEMRKFLMFNSAAQDLFFPLAYSCITYAYCLSYMEMQTMHLKRKILSTTRTVRTIFEQSISGKEAKAGSKGQTAQPSALKGHWTSLTSIFLYLVL